jgi:hypothetical protein
MPVSDAISECVRVNSKAKALGDPRAPEIVLKTNYPLLVRRWRRGIRTRLIGWCRSALRGARCQFVQYRTCGIGVTIREYRQRDRGQHKDNRRPGGRFAENRGRSARTERRLTPHAAERSRDIGALTALQQHNNNQEQTNDDVNDGDQNSSHVSPIRREDSANFKIPSVSGDRSGAEGGI